MRSALSKIKRLQRVVSRRRKAVQALARAHAHVANLRRDALHQITMRLTRTKSAIVLEDLNVSSMMKNHHLAQAILDVGMYEFRRQLRYKGKWYGCEIRAADRFYPSTKHCSQWGDEERAGLGRTSVPLRTLRTGDRS